MTTAVQEQTQRRVTASSHEALLHEATERMLIIRQVMKQAGKEIRITQVAPELAKMGEGQYHALHSLYENEEGRLTAGDLAARCHVAEPTISKVVKSLEHSGLVERRTDPSNRRVVWVSLTPQGRAMHDQMLVHFSQALEGVLQPLTDQQLRDLILAFTHLESLFEDAGEAPTNREGF
jgi:DNA-binding MarR family transcriptional regulator